jgi:hypothetical protein
MVGARGPQLLVDGVDLAVEVVDQMRAGVDGAAPRLRDVEAVQQLAAGDTEEVGDRAGVAEGNQRGVDAVLEHRAVLDQVHPRARLLALAPDPWVGQPDLGHQVAVREHGKDARVDLVGLARQRRETFDLGRVGAQHVPAERFEAVVHNRAPVIDSITARTANSWRPTRRARPTRPSASGGDANSSTTSPPADSRQTSILRRLRSSPACNMRVGLLALAPR